MKTVFRVAALFAAYSTIGFGGNYAQGLLLADDRVSEPAVHVVADVEPVVTAAVTPRVVVDVKPTIVSRVQLRHGEHCTYELDRELTIPIRGVSELSIRAGSGFLHVEGRSGLEEIVVVGMLCASHEEYLDELTLSVEEGSEGEVRLLTHYPDRRSRNGGNTASIDLTVLVPLGLNLDVQDSSGDLEISGTGDLRIDDSSGSIRVLDIDGSLEIDDSSGGVEVENVGGDATIEDGSGGLSIHGVQGSLWLRDGSGSIEVSQVADDVVVESDGSGSIDVRSVGGDFVVERDGSGGIRHSGVEGRVEIPQRRRRGG